MVLAPDDLTYDLERLRLLILADESAGLDDWEAAMAEFRDAYLLDDCRRLLNAAKAWPLSEHGRARVREEEAVLAIEAGDWPRAGRLLQELLDTYRSLGDRHGEARTLGHLGMLADLNGDAATAAGYLAQTGVLFAELGDQHALAANAFNLGNLHDDLARWDEADAAYRQALDLYRSLEDVAGEAKALSALAAVRRSQGRWDEAAALYEESITLSRQADDLHALEGSADRDYVAEELLRRILREEKTQAVRSFLEMGVVARWFDPETVQVILEVNLADARKIYDQLRRHSFVERHPYGLKFHDKIRELLLERLKFTSQGEHDRLTQRLLAYYAEKAGIAPLEEVDQPAKPAETPAAAKYEIHIHGPAQGLVIGDDAQVQQHLTEHDPEDARPKK